MFQVVKYMDNLARFLDQKQYGSCHIHKKEKEQKKSNYIVR